QFHRTILTKGQLTTCEFLPAGFLLSSLERLVCRHVPAGPLQSCWPIHAPTFGPSQIGAGALIVQSGDDEDGRVLNKLVAPHWPFQHRPLEQSRVRLVARASPQPTQPSLISLRSQSSLPCSSTSKMPLSSPTPLSTPSHSNRSPSQLHQAANRIRVLEHKNGSNAHHPLLDAFSASLQQGIDKIIWSATGSNARNGDSAGVMTGIPHTFLLRESLLLSIERPVQGHYAHKVAFERIALTHKLKFLGWCQVPRSNSILSPVALNQESIIFQSIMVPNFNNPDALFDEKEFEFLPIGFTFALYPTNSLSTRANSSPSKLTSINMASSISFFNPIFALFIIRVFIGGGIGIGVAEGE
ncbi:glutamate synthase, partial [Puccinia sorghi]